MSLAKLAIPFLSAATLLAAGCDSARRISEANANECAACHGFPPAGVAAHAFVSSPRASDCNACHAGTVAADGTIIPGGAHMNGTRGDFLHPDPNAFSAPTSHGYAAERGITSCTACHVSYASCTTCHTVAGFADWQTNCTFCHGTKTQNYAANPDLRLAAPPEGVHGETLTTERQVGAHQKHLRGGGYLSDGIGCDECHTVPSDLTHLDGVAKITFGTLATQGGLVPSYAGGTCATTYCHGSLDGAANPTPSWTGSVACGDCHGLPPLTGQHDFHVQNQGFACSICHATVADSTPSPGIRNAPEARALHVNGMKDVSLAVSGTWDPVAKSCTSVSCHGGTRSWY